MKRIFEAIGMLFAFIWIMLTDEEAQRQLDYDNGEGEKQA